MKLVILGISVGLLLSGCQLEWMSSGSSAKEGPSPADVGPDPELAEQATDWGVVFSSAGETVQSRIGITLSSNFQPERAKAAGDSVFVFGASGPLLRLNSAGGVYQFESPVVASVKDIDYREGKVWLVGDDSEGGSSVWSSGDLGQSWTRDLNTTADFFYSVTTHQNLDKLESIIAVPSGKIFVTGRLRDSGPTLLYHGEEGWEEWLGAIDWSVVGSIAQIFFRIIYVENEDEVYFLGSSKGVATSVDLGASWSSEEVFSGAERLKAIDCEDLLCLLVGDQGTLTTTSLGQVHESVQYPPSLNISAVDVFLHPDPSMGFRYYLGSEQGEIYYSDDNGLTWVKQTTGSRLPVRSILVTSLTEGVAVTGSPANTLRSILKFSAE